jgi:hypothetical protein
VNLSDSATHSSQVFGGATGAVRNNAASSNLRPLLASFRRRTRPASPAPDSPAPCSQPRRPPTCRRGTCSSRCVPGPCRRGSACPCCSCTSRTPRPRSNRQQTAKRKQRENRSHAQVAAGEALRQRDALLAGLAGQRGEPAWSGNAQCERAYARLLALALWRRRRSRTRSRTRSRSGRRLAARRVANPNATGARVEADACRIRVAVTALVRAAAAHRGVCQATADQPNASGDATSCSWSSAQSARRIARTSVGTGQPSTTPQSRIDEGLTRVVSPSHSAAMRAASNSTIERTFTAECSGHKKPVAVGSRKRAQTQTQLFFYSFKHTILLIDPSEQTRFAFA